MAGGRPGRAAQAEGRSRGRTGAPPTRLRRAPRAAGRPRQAPARPRGGASTGARRARPARRPLSRALAVRAHSASGTCDRGDRRRPGEGDAHGAAFARGGRLREDRGRALRAPARRRGREEGRADGADGDARRAALPHARRALSRARPRGRTPHTLGERRPGPGADPRRHARADPGRRRPLRGRRCGGRRAAQLRRRAAPSDHRRPDPARPAHDGDADPPNARAHRLRRPLRERDREAARPTGSPSRRPG